MGVNCQTGPWKNIISAPVNNIAQWYQSRQCLLGEFRAAVKIIHFGKSTLLSNPLKYSLNYAERMKYNKYHRHLAYELRNETNIYQSVSTDTYSIGYMFQLVGAFEKFDFFENEGKQMKSRSPIRRMSIDAADKELKKFIQSYTFC